jgi:hypothetical protein
VFAVVDDLTVDETEIFESVPDVDATAAGSPSKLEDATDDTRACDD